MKIIPQFRIYNLQLLVICKLLSAIISMFGSVIPVSEENLCREKLELYHCIMDVWAGRFIYGILNINVLLQPQTQTESSNCPVIV